MTVAAFGLAVGCNIVTDPQVVLLLNSRTPVTDGATVTVSIFDRDGTARVDNRVLTIGPDGDVVDLPIEITLTARDGDETRTFEVVATLSNEGVDRSLRVISQYLPDQVAELEVFFTDDCGGMGPCPTGQTCYDGVCFGACFTAGGEGEALPRCGECESCVGARCEANRQGQACGCGQTCSSSGTCEGANVTGVAVGAAHTCATENGDLYCWGQNGRGQLGLAIVEAVAPTMPIGRFNDVDVRGDHTCAVDFDQQLHCWGRGDDGRLGQGPGPDTYDDRSTPTAVSVPQEVRGVALGVSHTCALGSDGRAYCFGASRDGRLGIGPAGMCSGSSEDVLSASAVSGGIAFSQLCAGSDFSCGLDVAGQVHCWGNGMEFHTGQPDSGCRSVPTEVMALAGTWDSIACGSFSACARRSDGEVWCWGGTNRGQVGTGSFDNGGVLPTRVSGERLYSTLACGGSTCCALQAQTSALYCWGVLPTGAGNVAVPTLIPSPLQFDQLAVGPPLRPTLGTGRSSVVCATTVDNLLYCIGDNTDGRLGTGDREPRDAPARVCLP